MQDLSTFTHGDTPYDNHGYVIDTHGQLWLLES